MLTINEYLNFIKMEKKFEGFDTFGSMSREIKAHVRITTSYISFSDKALSIMGCKEGDNLMIKSKIDNDRNLVIMIVAVPTPRPTSIRLKRDKRVASKVTIISTSFGKKKLKKDDERDYYVTFYGNNHDEKWFELKPASKIQAVETYKEV